MCLSCRWADLGCLGGLLDLVVYADACFVKFECSSISAQVIGIIKGSVKERKMIVGNGGRRGEE